MVVAGVPDLIVKKLQGHALSVSDAYFEPTAADLDAAIRKVDWSHNPTPAPEAEERQSA